MIEDNSKDQMEIIKAKMVLKNFDSWILSGIENIALKGLIQDIISQLETYLDNSEIRYIIARNINDAVRRWINEK